MADEWRAPKRVREAARRLRNEMTPAEVRLWSALRRQQTGGHRFRRQHPIWEFVADFCCVQCRLIVEVDGADHRYRGEADIKRQKWLEVNGYRVIRFTNNEIMDNLDGVVEAIRRVGGHEEGSG